MVISIENRQHGVVVGQLMTRMAEELPEVFVRLRKGNDRSSYVLDLQLENAKEICRFGLYLKHSSARRSPWRYTFLKDHQEEIRSLVKASAAVFVIFVNGDDGIACVRYDQFKKLLDEIFEQAEWVSVSRKLHQPYHIVGKDGRLDRTLPRKSFPGSIIEAVFEAVVGTE
jgi:hypothetical protein